MENERSEIEALLKGALFSLAVITFCVVYTTLNVMKIKSNSDKDTHNIQIITNAFEDAKYNQ